MTRDYVVVGALGARARPVLLTRRREPKKFGVITSDSCIRVNY